MEKDSIQAQKEEPDLAELLDERAEVAKELGRREDVLGMIEQELEQLQARRGEIPDGKLMDFSIGELRAREGLRRVLDGKLARLEQNYNAALEEVRRARERLQEVEIEIKGVGTSKAGE